MLSTALEKSAWQNLIPHAGSMCLLDQVLSWDATRIHCNSRSHQAADNPLRRDGRLAAVHLIEYGAQAMAVHGGLLAQASGQRAQPGYLVAARDVQLEVEFLDDIPEALQVQAEILSVGDSGWMYQFTISAAGNTLAHGRVSVIHSGETSA